MNFTISNELITSLHAFASHWLILLITLVILVYLAIEAISHRFYLSKIPIRIHVNGTRGKSSITRLIAAGLRQGGIVTCAKTTGTLPRFISPDGSEHDIYRPSRPNILEQIQIIKQAAHYRPTVIVMECMAVQPLLQSLCELVLIRSTHGVISNARADHLDVMGPEEADVALALAGTTPVKGNLYTTEKKYFPILKTAATDRKTKLIAITENDLTKIDDTILSGFFYTEHKENVALALRICEDLGVPRDIALEGMWQAKPDPGALVVYEFNQENCHLFFVNAFAANDPISSGKLWHQFLLKYPHCKQRIALINCRDDRKQRSQQLAKACLEWEAAEQYIVIGTGTTTFINAAKKYGIDKNLLINAARWTPKEIVDYLTNNVQDTPRLIVGMGNIAGMGLQVVEFFARQQNKINQRSPHSISNGNEARAKSSRRACKYVCEQRDEHVTKLPLERRGGKHD